MQKHIFWIAIIAFFGLFMSYDASAHGRGSGHRHHYKEQKRAYKHGYYQGVRHANRYDRRHHGYYAHNRPYRHHYNRPYRSHRRHPGYYAPAPRPYVRGGVSINIPLPPHPPHPYR
jgi:hypothetical protein